MSTVEENSEVMDAAVAIVGIVRHIVDHPDKVEIRVRPGTLRIAVELFTDPADVGQVVGRNGHLSTSLRSFLSAVAGKHKIRIDFDYVTEEENSRKQAEGRRDFPHPTVAVT